MKYRKALDWIEDHEYQVRSRREKGMGEWLIWWTVTTRLPRHAGLRGRCWSRGHGIAMSGRKARG